MIIRACDSFTDALSAIQGHDEELRQLVNCAAIRIRQIEIDNDKPRPRPINLDEKNLAVIIIPAAF